MLVFQYGSNMSSARLNSEKRLAGDAKHVGVAHTKENHEFHFPVWSRNNKCAAASITPSPTGRKIFGVLYEVSESLIDRQKAKAIDRKPLDAIEGEGTNYSRTTIEVLLEDQTVVTATTYVAKSHAKDIKTSKSYVMHILDGAIENNAPEEYIRYLISKITDNNPDLKLLQKRTDR